MKESVTEIEKYWNLGDEWANWLTHGVGCILSFIALFFLIKESFTEDIPLWEALAYSIYGSCLVFLYAISTLYHSVKNVKWKHFFRLLDHCAIYLFIAGSYTPFALLVLKGVWAWSIFTAIWVLAFAGIIFKVLFIGRFDKLSTCLYLGMGWLVIIAAEPLIQNLSLEGLFWLAGGGGFYTFGVFFYSLDRFRFFHAIWHLFVMAGSYCHFFAIYHYIH